jgi:uncharacterized protein (UPF0147 family)
MSEESLTVLRKQLSQDIDYVLEWLYGGLPKDIVPLVEGLGQILCDKTEPSVIRLHAAEALQAIGPDPRAMSVFAVLVGSLDGIRKDPTEPLAIRSAALSARASMGARI